MRYHINRMPTLVQRLERLPLSEISQIMAFLGIDKITSATGNVSAWSLASQAVFEIGKRELYAALNSVLLSTEMRLGLDSPDWLPWPIEIHLTLHAYAHGKPRLILTSEDIGIAVNGDSFESMMEQARAVAEMLILSNYGLDVRAINERVAGESTTMEFDCLRLICIGWVIEAESRVEFDTLVASLHGTTNG